MFLVQLKHKEKREYRIKLNCEKKDKIEKWLKKKEKKELNRINYSKISNEFMLFSLSDSQFTD